VFDDDYRIAQIAELPKNLNEPRRIARMETDTRFVENIERTGQVATERRGEIDALALTSGERGGGLSQLDTGKTLYILDEPNTGLHFEDIRVLMNVLKKLVDKGNTVIVIEHNLDVIKMADYIIDMGPEGGKGGGELLSCGTPEEVAKSEKGYTPKFLREELGDNY
jgi:excinuclease UvrABC ATPase subunit